MSQPIGGNPMARSARGGNNFMADLMQMRDNEVSFESDDDSDGDDFFTKVDRKPKETMPNMPVTMQEPIIAAEESKLALSSRQNTTRVGPSSSTAPSVSTAPVQPMP